MRRSDVVGIREMAKESFADHLMVEEPVRSFRFHSVYLTRKAEVLKEGSYPFAKHRVVESGKFNYNSHYAFTLTWTPGHLTLVGDLGELTLVHYRALRRFEDISWALSADHQYLMSKTNVREVYDKDETIRDVVRMLNEEPISALNGSKSWPHSKRMHGLRQELQEWRASDPEDRDAEPPRLDHGYVPWHHWLQVWNELRGDAFGSKAGLASVKLAKNRRELKDEMEVEFETAYRAAIFLSKCGFDDYYGSYVWPERTYWQIAAIQHGVKMILAAQNQKEAAA